VTIWGESEDTRLSSSECSANDSIIVLAESDNAVTVNAVTLYAGTTLASTKHAKALAIVSAIDTSIGITLGLPDNAILRAFTYHASTIVGETRHTIPVSMTDTRYPGAPVVIGPEHTAGIRDVRETEHAIANGLTRRS
jgi:hypothetical protein